MASAIHALTDALTSAVLAQAGDSAPATASSAPSGPVEVTGMPTNGAASETAQPLGGIPANGQAAPKGGLMTMMLPMALVVIVMFIMTSQMGKKDKKRREELMKGIKRQDKVVTASGIIGTVIEMNDEEVVLRVEEGKIRVSKASIGQVLRESKAGSVAELKADGKPVGV